MIELWFFIIFILDSPNLIGPLGSFAQCGEARTEIMRTLERSQIKFSPGGNCFHITIHKAHE